MPTMRASSPSTACPSWRSTMPTSWPTPGASRALAAEQTPGVPRGGPPGTANSGLGPRRGRRRRARTDWRLAGAVLAGRAASALSRRMGRGGGTVIAGHVVPRLAPNALRRLSAALPDGVLLVSGTNGKTTTSRLLAQVLRASGRRVVHNRAGANLLTGIISALAQAADLRGRPRADIGLFE